MRRSVGTPLTASDMSYDDLLSEDTCDFLMSTPKRKKSTTPIKRRDELISSAWSPIRPGVHAFNDSGSSASAWSPNYSTPKSNSSSAWSFSAHDSEVKKRTDLSSSAWSPELESSCFELTPDNLERDTVIACDQVRNSPKSPFTDSAISLEAEHNLQYTPESESIDNKSLVSDEDRSQSHVHRSPSIGEEYCHATQTSILAFSCFCLATEEP